MIKKLSGKSSIINNYAIKEAKNQSIDQKTSKNACEKQKINQAAIEKKLKTSGPKALC